MPKKQQNAVWRFTRHGGQTMLGYGAQSHANSHAAAMSQGSLNSWTVEPVDVTPAKFKAMVASGAIFDIADRLVEDQRRHAAGCKAYRKLLHYGNERVPLPPDYDDRAPPGPHERAIIDRHEAGQ